MQLDVSPPLAAVNPRLGFLVRQFHRAVERQRARDAELVAAFERVARNSRVRRLIKEITQESER